MKPKRRRRASADLSEEATKAALAEALPPADVPKLGFRV